MLIVEENYANGVPQTALRGWAPTGAAWHWTAGGPGRDGWEGSLVHLITTGWSVNASYHGGLWHEHEPNDACRTIIQWVVPVSSAAHSIAPSQVFQLNVNKDRATQDARFAEVRRILGAKATDPNAACIAVAYAGMPLGLEKDLACPVFRADVQELARALIAETPVIDQPHFGHGWIQPITRYEMDVATDFIGLLYEAAAAPPQEEPDVYAIAMKHQIPKIVRLRPGVTLYRNSRAATPSDVHHVLGSDGKDLDGMDAELFGSLDGRWVGRRAGADGFFFFDDNAIDRGVPFRLAVYGADTDCSDDIATAEAAVTAHVNQEWRDWLATAPAAPAN